MRLKLIPELFATALFMAAISPACAQVGPSAVQGGLPIVVGAGFSNYAMDYGTARMDGIAAWIDFYPRGLPRVISGLGIEAEGRDINFGRPSNIPRLRQDTGLIGVIYPWNHYRNFRPYAKYLAGQGSYDFPPLGNYTHDTFLVLAPGGGAEYRVWQDVWVRADYEYQFWHLWAHDPTPQGLTFGVSYDFRHHE
jgi:hypothetical protein